ncbi:cysteine protease StiP family protein [Planococcus shenhongbingii]|uniref:Cysteine protease StiP family protein n=1 Tax=Planococcus shenhongbingii TaxID=3058398 RepID=A0ABT8NAS5_9BACL|nr:cysteine protease StiP family protein [Planococcus sp. N017]MDN7244993.1 cysteine protease StiP family protein [Planococcus sp. N017]
MIATGLVKTSYPEEDIIFLLKDVTEEFAESTLEEREKAVRTGAHYSERLPMEYRPSVEYTALYHKTVAKTKQRLGFLIGLLTRRIALNAETEDIVLVSLARAGSPIGILIRRYAAQVLGFDWPHYSVSILRGKGIDENAIEAIRELHPASRIQFVDGWTGKGAIQKELTQSVGRLNARSGLDLHDDMAVLADPGACAVLFGTREDFLIPSACLNATVSGLISRTILNGQFIGKDDFHGAKFYGDLLKEDLSNDFVDQVTACFMGTVKDVENAALATPVSVERTWQGMKEVEEIGQKMYNESDYTLIKPGVGETTRVLLRRSPWKVLVNDLEHPDVQHLLVLAKEKNVPVELVPELFYRAIGLIRSGKEI